MPNDPPRILAINPGSRYIGLAAFRGPELLDWMVKVVTGKTHRSRIASARTIVLDAVDRFGPEVLAIKRLHRSRSSQQLEDLVAEINALARRRRLKFRQYSIDDVKGALCPEARTNKRKLAEKLCRIHPATAHDFQRETQNRNPYHVRMFEAVALGTVCYQQIEKQ